MKEILEILQTAGPYGLAVLLWMWKESERKGRDDAERELREQGLASIKALNEVTNAISGLRRSLFPRREPADAD